MSENTPKQYLTDSLVGQLAYCEHRSFRINDTIVRGFFVLIGRRTRTYVAQGEYWQNGVREFSARVTLGHHPELTAREARKAAREVLGLIARGERPPNPRSRVAPTPRVDPAEPKPGSDLTLRVAWDRYRVSHLERKNRSPATIAGYRDHVERLMVDWLDRPIGELADDPDMVARRHDLLTAQNGPFAANGCMRTLRAIYNHAWKKNKRVLPPENPADAIDWNPERRRNTAMGATALSPWFSQLAVLENTVRREFHLFLLLSGGRPGATKAARREHLDLRRRILHIAKPKGGEMRAFDIPLSREMVRCLIRVIRIGRVCYPSQSEEWLFPADSESGHLEDHKEDRKLLSKWGNDLRQSYRTLGVAAGISEIDAKLLMNHSIPGVNAGYITRGVLTENYLRRQQQAISNLIFTAIMKERASSGPIRAWLEPGATRIAYRTALDAERGREVVDVSWLRLVA